jgi:hypothetical protein
MTHGKQSSYVSGCRCDLCRAANSDYQKRYRKTEKGRATARRNAKIQRQAQALALAYLRVNDRRTYFGIYDMAKESVLAEEIANMEKEENE